MNTSEGERRYIPAAGHDLLLPLYDPLVRLLMREEQTRGALLAAAELRPGLQVLDLGCGTGAMSLLLAQRHPGIQVTGLDPDPKALARASDKAARAGLEIRFEQGFGDAIPHAEQSFDRVLSSLMLHHLTTQEKQRTFAEVLRVLRPGGLLLVLDFGPPRAWIDRVLTFAVHRGQRIADNLAGRLPELMRGAGLVEARELKWIRTAFGGLALYRAQRSAS